MAEEMEWPSLHRKGKPVRYMTASEKEDLTYRMQGMELRGVTRKKIGKAVGIGQETLRSMLGPSRWPHNEYRGMPIEVVIGRSDEN